MANDILLLYNNKSIYKAVPALNLLLKALLNF